jgi:hypothetical protein
MKMYLILEKYIGLLFNDRLKAKIVFEEIETLKQHGVLVNGEIRKLIAEIKESYGMKDYPLDDTVNQICYYFARQYYKSLE